ncbi:MAG: pyridoxal-dependent decarboxylase, partial [Acidimicrobiales bacterium]
MHEFDESADELAWSVFRYALNRVRMDPPPLDGPRSPEELRRAVGETITPAGLGGARALELFVDELAPSCISTDHQRFLAFVPAAPSEASVLFDMLVGASSLYAGSWLEGAGAVYAENQALRWLADLAGLPDEAGGCFVPGGTTANLSALVAARHDARRERPDRSGSDDKGAPG